MNADDRESSIVFDNEQWEGQGNLYQQETGSKIKDPLNQHETQTTSPRNFFDGLSWQDSSQAADPKQNSDSDDDFEKEWQSIQSRNKNLLGHKNQENSFFQETPAGEVKGDLDLFNLKSDVAEESLSGENLQEVRKENVDLFNFGAPSGNVDLLNINSDIKTAVDNHEQNTPELTVHGNDQDNLGVDLLSLSPSKTKDSQNVDLFVETGHKPMRRNRSADDILADLHDHHDHDFFSQLGSRSSSSSRENVATFTVGDKISTGCHGTNQHSETFDPLRPKESIASDVTFDPFSPGKGPTSGTFDFSPEVSTPDPFDPFGVHASAHGGDSFEAFSSSSTATAHQHVANDRRPRSQGFNPPKLPQQQRVGTTARPVSLGSLSAGIPQQHISNTKTSPQPSPAPSPKPAREHPVFGGWGNTESNGNVVGATPLLPQKIPTQQGSPCQASTNNTAASNVTDPFAEFGNLKSSLPHSSSTPQFQTSKPSPQTFSNSGQQTWSKPQQPAWQNRATPGSPSQARAKPNYTPNYNPVAGSSVFGTYGLRNTSGNYPKLNLVKESSSLLFNDMDIAVKSKLTTGKV